ncbi:thiamine diphosphokinase [Paenibacillus dakarensis]|uniref:thiamine diphosphokinase n=1 Tax=Paenibacillus dakarensis TaxID=1527293 RepID=UPI0006D55D01|nr:thiamine diphosphokinase [Paenibacillus dakarensis]
MGDKRILIFTGGNLSLQLLEVIQDNDYIIGADRGALFLIDNGIIPHISVGDFDSVTPEQLEQVTLNSRKMVKCDPVNKDLTDTELAFDTALELNPSEIILLGGTGTRIDHTLANIHMLLRGVQHHVRCSILDEHNFITLTGSTCVVEDLGFTYVSLLPLTPEVTGIDLEGFQYPLHNATLKLGQSLGISNRLSAKRGTVKVEGGLLLIIQSKDK